MSPVGPLLQRGDLLGDVTPEERGVLPRGDVQGLGHHVLLEAVHPVGEPEVLGGGRPEQREDLIRHAPQEDRLGGEDLVDLEPLLVLGRASQRPGVLPVPVVLVSRCLDDAVQRHELRHDDASHSRPRAG